jgi:hypothetical protein
MAEGKITSLEALRNQIFDYVKFSLGGGMVDVELDPEHYQFALERAISMYRMRAENAFEESFAFMTLQQNVQEYTLPQEIDVVKQIYRRTIGSASNAGANSFEPFEAGYLNTYLLTVGRTGGLLSYELYTQYQDLTARMFGGYLLFTFNTVTKKLTLVRRPQSTGEIVLLQTFNLKPEVQLLTDYKTKNWIREYTYSKCKFMLGEARSKFNSIAGPQGGTTLNGEALKAEATAELLKHEEDLKNYVDGSMPLSFIFG